MSTTNSLKTPLHGLHLSAGARMVDFHGWAMPVQYAGITAEHEAVRTHCGLFDLGHMGRLLVSGPAATAFLDQRITRPIASMQHGQVRYGLICTDDGTVIDDVLVSCEADDRFHIVVNASNKDTVLRAWFDDADLLDGVTIADLTDEQAMIAAQGPKAAELLAELRLTSDDLAYYHFRDHTIDGHTIRISRTGYTGEDGFELFMPRALIEAWWQRIVDAGATLCGLGARDTLRLEAGMPLYGQELDREHTPIEAGLGFACGKGDNYTGSAVIQQQRASGTRRTLVGLKITGKRPARHGYRVLSGDEVVGTVTSGAPSPTLGHGIAMAYVHTDVSNVGNELTIDIRGRSTEAATVVALPFYKRPKSQ